MKTKQQFIRMSAVPALVLTLITLFASPLLQAQTTYKLSGAAQSIMVLGKSNVHDWTMKSPTMESQGAFKVTDDQLRSLSEFSFSVNSKSLKSGKSSMDGRTYTAMKASEYPKVTYKQASATVTQTLKNKFQIKSIGKLTIAGTAQTITINILAVVNANNSITCSGSEKLKLTDYNIAPPSFMLGAMKVANDLTVQFNLVYKASTSIASN